MSRAARKSKTKTELQKMSLDELNAELRYFRTRHGVAGASVVAKQYAKEVAKVESVRLKKFGFERK